MKKSFLLRAAALLLTAALLLALPACGGTQGEATRLSFKTAASYEYLKTLDGKTVTINGYMATSSPADGSFLFLMNMPYQSCPFCIPNTTQLSNTMEVYPKQGQSFYYTTQAINIVGTLVVAPDVDEPFTDLYGYEFTYKIIDATYTILQESDLGSDLALWQRIAESDVITDIYAMYDYVNFLCKWNTYYVKSHTNAEGETVPGYYLFPEDATYYIYTDGAQWNYGYQEGYFDGIIADIRKIDPTAFEALVSNVEKAKALADRALAELENGNYTAEYQYLEMFERYDYMYTLTNGEALNAEMNEIYTDFSDWLGSWEL